MPILLFYVYGVVPVSLCRSGGCGVSTSPSGGVRFDFDDEESIEFFSSKGEIYIYFFFLPLGILELFFFWLAEGLWITLFGVAAPRSIKKHNASIVCFIVPVRFLFHCNL